MMRFFHSRTGALLTLGVLVAVLGFGLRQKPAAPFLAQTTQGGTCGNSRVETGEECEQDIDCPGIMRCLNCQCTEVTQCWSQNPQQNPYCDKTVSVACGAGKQCQDCICRDCGRCLVGYSGYENVTNNYNAISDKLFGEIVRLDDSHVVAVVVDGARTWPTSGQITLVAMYRGIEGKRITGGTSPSGSTVSFDIDTFMLSGNNEYFDGHMRIAALDSSHIVVAYAQGQSPSGPDKCVVKVLAFNASGQVTAGPAVEVPSITGQSCARVAVAALSPTKIVAARGGYESGLASARGDAIAVGDVNLSTNSVTFGQASTMGWTVALAPVGTDRVAAIYSDQSCFADPSCPYQLKIGAVSGTAITWGTPVALTSNSNPLTMYASDANRVLIGNYSNFDGASVNPSFVLGTVQGTAVTLGSLPFTQPVAQSFAIASSPTEIVMFPANGLWRCTGTTCSPLDTTPPPASTYGIGGVALRRGVMLGPNKFITLANVQYVSGGPGQQGGGNVWNDLALRVSEITCPACAASCGNGRTEADEQCGEPGMSACPEGTICQHCFCAVRKSGTPPVCGDGVVNSPEQCDWGNASFIPGASNNYPTGYGTHLMAVAQGDMNGDGKIDIVAADRNSLNYPDTSVRMWFNRGTYYEPASPGWTLQDHPRELVVRDFDRDGKQDIILTTYERPYLLFAKGNGDGTRRSVSRIFGNIFSTEYSANRNLITADFNQDTYPDIAFSYGLNKTAVSLGSANGFAAPALVLDQGVEHLALGTGDFNRDAKPDLALLRSVGAGTVVSVLRGNGNGTFQSPQDYSIEPTKPNGGPLVVADINGDNYDDILAQPAFAGRVSILVNNAGSFTIKSSANGVINAPAFCLTDYDRDGRKDLVTGEYELGVLAVYFGKADATFSTVPDRVLRPAQYTVTNFLCEDLDGDGKVDLAAVHGEPQGAIDQSYTYGHEPYNGSPPHSGTMSVCLSRQGGCELRNPCTSGTCNGVTCRCDGVVSSASSLAVSSSSSAAQQSVSSVASSQASLNATWIDCPAGCACNKQLSPQCATRGLNPPAPPCTTIAGPACGTAQCSGSCTCTICPGSSSSSRPASASSTAVSSQQSSAAASSVAASSIASSAQSSVGAGASSTQTSSQPATVSSSSVHISSAVSSQAGITVSSVSSTVTHVYSSSSAAAAVSSAAQSSSVLIFDDGPTPPSPRCGNGMLESGEACDTGIPCQNGGFCTAQCQCRSANASSRSEEISADARCGDGILSPGEGCDSGNPCSNGGFCTASCTCEQRGTVSLCGNGVLNIREECDDGNAADGDGCDARCRREVTMQDQDCGNAFLEGSEQCETNSPCPRPGDQCQNCQCFVPSGTVCGNGVLEFSEQCETTTPCLDASFICSRCTCLAPVCGDGTRTKGEECDDGNTMNDDGCSSACSKETPNLIASQMLCGNGIVEGGEQCDDGNQTDRDGCSAVCAIEIPSSTNTAAEEAMRLSLLTDRPAEVPALLPVRTGPTPKKAPALPSPAPSTGVRPQMRPAAVQPQVPFPAPAYPVAATVTQQVPQQYPAYWQPYGSAVPYAPVSGPVGKTGPASLAIMVSGAAAGMTWMRRKRTTLLTLRKKS